MRCSNQAEMQRLERVRRNNERSLRCPLRPMKVRHIEAFGIWNLRLVNQRTFLKILLDHPESLINSIPKRYTRFSIYPCRVLYNGAHPQTGHRRGDGSESHQAPSSRYLALLRGIIRRRRPKQDATERRNASSGQPSWKSI